MSKLDNFDGYALPVDKENEARIIANAIKDITNREMFLRRIDPLDFRVQEFQTLAYAIKLAAADAMEIGIDSVMLKSKVAPVRFPMESSYLAEILENFKLVSASDYEKYVHQLKVDSVKSQITDNIFNSLYRICLNPAADLNQIETRVDYLKNVIKIGRSSSVLEFQSMEQIIGMYKENFGKNDNFKTTGFRHLDERLNEGLSPKAITVIAGPPGSGKSSFTLSMMKNLAHKGTHAAQFALEMNNMALTTKLLAFNTQLPVTALTKDIKKLKDVEKQIYDYEMERLARSKFLHFADKPTQTLATIREQILLLQDHLKVEYMVVPIDLFGKIRDFAGSDNFARDYEKKLNEVQVMVRELAIHFILVAQINREATKGTNKRPKMSNLKNAGALEEVADLIFALYRPYYDPDKALADEIQHNSLSGKPDVEYDVNPEDFLERFLAEVIILKQRMGLGNQIVNFFMDPKTTRFQPFDTVDQEIIAKISLRTMGGGMDDE